jgi:hypothetical protein
MKEVRNGIADRVFELELLPPRSRSFDHIGTRIGNLSKKGKVKPLLNKEIVRIFSLLLAFKVGQIYPLILA